MLFNVFNAQMQDMGIALSIARIAGLEVEERRVESGERREERGKSYWRVFIKHNLNLIRQSLSTILSPLSSLLSPLSTLHFPLSTK